MPNQVPQSLTITRPDDWHLHLRDGAAMASVLPHTAHQFARAIGLTLRESKTKRSQKI